MLITLIKIIFLVESSYLFEQAPGSCEPPEQFQYLKFYPHENQGIAGSYCDTRVLQNNLYPQCFIYDESFELNYGPSKDPNDMTSSYLYKPLKFNENQLLGVSSFHNQGAPVDMRTPYLFLVDVSTNKPKLLADAFPYPSLTNPEKGNSALITSYSIVDKNKILVSGVYDYNPILPFLVKNFIFITTIDEETNVIEESGLLKETLQSVPNGNSTCSFNIDGKMVIAIFAYSKSDKTLAIRFYNFANGTFTFIKQSSFADTSTQYNNALRMACFSKDENSYISVTYNMNSQTSGSLGSVYIYEVTSELGLQEVSSIDTPIVYPGTVEQLYFEEAQGNLILIGSYQLTSQSLPFILTYSLTAELKLVQDYSIYFKDTSLYKNFSDYPKIQFRSLEVAVDGIVYISLIARRDYSQVAPGGTIEELQGVAAFELNDKNSSGAELIWKQLWNASCKTEQEGSDYLCSDNFFTLFFASTGNGSTDYNNVTDGKFVFFREICDYKGSGAYFIVDTVSLACPKFTFFKEALCRPIATKCNCLYSRLGCDCLETLLNLASSEDFALVKEKSFFSGTATPQKTCYFFQFEPLVCLSLTSFYFNQNNDAQTSESFEA